MTLVSKLISYPCFSNWDQVIDLCKQNDVHCLEISKDQIVHDLEVIRQFVPKHFSQKSEFDLLNSWLNGVERFDGAQLQESIHYGFIHDLHKLAGQVDIFIKIPSSKKLIAKGILRHFGLYTQFQVVLWLNKYLQITDQEFKIGEIDVDVQARVAGTPINIQIKDIREVARQDRQEEAIMVIDSVLSDRARKMGLDKNLSLKTFKGVPPDKVPQTFWEHLARNMDYSEGSQTVVIPALKGRNTEPVTIKMIFIFRDFNGTFIHPTRGFDNSLRLQYEYNKIDSMIVPGSDSFLLIAVSEDQYNWESLSRDVKKGNVGLVLLDIDGDGLVERSPFMLPTKDGLLQDTLNAAIPESAEI